MAAQAYKDVVTEVSSITRSLNCVSAFSVVLLLTTVSSIYSKRILGPNCYRSQGILLRRSYHFKHNLDQHLIWFQAASAKVAEYQSARVQERNQTQEFSMCFYHAYDHRCGHTEMVFIQLCASAQMIQKKCPRGKEGTILTTVKVEHPCTGCPKK